MFSVFLCVSRLFLKKIAVELWPQWISICNCSKLRATANRLTVPVCQRNRFAILRIFEQLEISLFKSAFGGWLAPALQLLEIWSCCKSSDCSNLQKWQVWSAKRFEIAGKFKQMQVHCFGKLGQSIEVQLLEPATFADLGSQSMCKSSKCRAIPKQVPICHSGRVEQSINRFAIARNVRQLQSRLLPHMSSTCNSIDRLPQSGNGIVLLLFET